METVGIVQGGGDFPPEFWQGCDQRFHFVQPDPVKKLKMKRICACLGFEIQKMGNWGRAGFGVCAGF